MMNDPTTHQAPFSDPGDDTRRLLCDAYDAPPLPATLRQRLDRVVSQEWGNSPELADSLKLAQGRSAPLTRSVSDGSVSTRSRWRNSAPVAACAALVLAAFLLFGRGSQAYAWASMVRALEQQGIVQLDGGGVTRWLSLSAGVLGERTGGERTGGERTGASHTLVDVRQEVVLEHGQGEAQIRRRRIPGRFSPSDHDRLVLAFLLGSAQTQAGAERLRGARLICQSWEYARLGDRQTVTLTTSWETEQAERFGVRLSLDPATQLPIACDVTGQGVPANTLTCSYPATRVADLRSDGFPAAATIVDVDDEGTAVQPADVASTDQGSPLAANDGPRRDVAAAPMAGAASQWKPVEMTPRPRREVVLKIDATLEELWHSQQLEPAPPADDAELMRRAYLDLAGRTPSVHEIRAYLADKSSQRYDQLVDRLLQSRDHTSHLATTWRTFLIPEGVDLTAFGGIDKFDQWLADEFGKNASYDSVVRSLLLAGGRLSRSGPLLFYSAAKLDPDVLAARSARVFLGMRLECAQCHNHPFEPWTQEEFWNLAAFFAQISRPQGELKAVSTVMQVHDVDHGDVRLPKSDTVIPPRFLNGGGGPDTTGGESRRQQLARWLTSVENPYFSRATANRAWSIMFGKGIVDPVDDFGIRHPPKSPQLLDLLAGHFASSGFDLRELFRTIALSRAYRLSSGAATADTNRTECFAQMNVKTLTAEQVYDCITVATMLDMPTSGDPYAFNVNRYNNTNRDQFLQQFRTPAGRSTEYLGGIPQALTMMNGGLIGDATGLSTSGMLKSLDAPFFTNRQRIEVLYLAALSRYPRPSEWQLLSGYIGDKTSGALLRENLSDILWALLNSAEFTMNH